MAGIDSKRMIGSLMVLMMVVLAQGEDELAVVHPTTESAVAYPATESAVAHPTTESAVAHPAAQLGHCAKHCFFKCIKLIIPPRIALCFGLCMVKCKLQPPQGVYNCTHDCSNSITHAYNPDAEKVEIIVGSCYKTCKHKNNN